MSGETKANISAWNVDTLKEHVDLQMASYRGVIDERDRLYKERDESRRTAVDAALTAVKEQTAAAFISSEKAIVKAEEAQKAYNASHNDLARKMDEQNKATMPRTETEARFRSLEEKISEMRDSLSIGHGSALERRTVIDTSRSNLAFLVSAAGLLVSIAVGGLLLVRYLTGN